MADLGKNGYSWTGYTEPFIVPTGVTITSAASLSTAIGANVGAILTSIPIENTEHRNNMMYVRSLITSATTTTFTTKDINFDTRSNVNANTWILNIAGAYVTVTSVTYDVPTETYTIVVSASVDVVIGTAYRVVGRVVDVGASVASQNYVAGDKVVEIYV